MRHIERQPQKQIKLCVCVCVRAIGMRSVAGRRSARNADPNNQKSRSRLITHTHTTPITRFYILLLYTRIYTVIVCVNQQQQKEIVKINHRNQPNTKRICVNSMRLSPPKHFPIALHGDQTIDWVLSRQSVCCSARISNHTHTHTLRDALATRNRSATLGHQLPVGGAAGGGGRVGDATARRGAATTARGTGAEQVLRGGRAGRRLRGLWGADRAEGRLLVACHVSTGAGVMKTTWCLNVFDYII